MSVAFGMLSVSGDRLLVGDRCAVPLHYVILNAQITQTVWRCWVG